MRAKIFIVVVPMQLSRYWSIFIHFEKRTLVVEGDKKSSCDCQLDRLFQRVLHSDRPINRFAELFATIITTSLRVCFM